MSIKARRNVCHRHVRGSIVNSQESTGNRTRRLLGVCSRWFHQHSRCSCHTRRPSSCSAPGCSEAPGWGPKVGGEQSVSLLQPPLAPWGRPSTAGHASHTSSWPSYKCSRRGSSGSCRRSTRPEKMRQHTHTHEEREKGEETLSLSTLFDESMILSVSTDGTHIWIWTAAVSLLGPTAGGQIGAATAIRACDGAGGEPPGQHPHQQAQSSLQHLHQVGLESVIGETIGSIRKDL